MKRRAKTILLSMMAVAMAAFSTSVIIASKVASEATRGTNSDPGTVDFTRAGAIKKLDDNKYSISGTTANGTTLYLISTSESDIKNTNYVASFASVSSSYSITFAYDVNGTSPMRFQSLKKVTLETHEDAATTYNLYYSSTDGVTFTDEHEELEVGNSAATKVFAEPKNFLKIALGQAGASNITRVKLDYDCSYNADDILATEVDRSNAVREVTEAFDVLDIEEYATSKRQQIIDKLNETLDAIHDAVYLRDIQVAVKDCLSYFDHLVRAKDVVAGTWFDKKSSEAKYEFDRDNENNLVIMYNGYPGNWVYVGTESLETDVTKNNFARIRFSNDSDNQIQVCIQFTGANSYKVDSHIMNIAAREVKTVELSYSDNVNKFYFFLDSCSEHSRSGQVTILETSLGYKDIDLPYSKSIEVNKAFTTETGDSIAYTIQEEDNAKFIMRVDALFQVNYHQNGDSKKHFGLHLYAGEKHVSPKESTCHMQDVTLSETDKGANGYTNMPIDPSYKLSVGSKVYMEVSYAAENLDFTLVKLILVYGTWETEVRETVDVNTQVYINGAGKDAEDNYYAATIPYSSFTKTGKVLRMDVTFTTVNTASYGKSQLYFTGFGFTSFSSGNNNVLNIGNYMNKDGNAEPRQETMTIYPVADIDLTSGAEISIVCWWSSATNITIDSVTMYTNNISAPSAVTDLIAHPVDSGMVLTWSRSSLASSYDVYVNSTKVDNVTTTYATIDGLNNNESYTFKVVAKNGSGDSEPTSVVATPVEGATYDNFIEGINTSLEEQIGSSDLSKFLNGGDLYADTANNNRLKKVINKMLNGEKTTVAFMGGSITVGETASLKDENNHAKGYAYYTYQWLKRNYDVQNKSEFVNGSICGTGSEIGIVRAQKDILNYNPDLVFIEFAANNGSTDFYRQSYESLIRKCTNLETDPAIVLVFACTTYTKNGSEGTYMRAIGEHYGLPMFSMQKGMEQICSVFDKARTDPIFYNFSDDGTHPNDNGHQLMAKGLCYSLRNQINRSTDDKNTYPASASISGYDKYDGLVAVDNTNGNSIITSLGSFAAANTATPSTRDQSDVTAFQQGWKKTATDANEPMTLGVTAKNFILIYEAGNPSVTSDPKGNIVVTYTNKANPSDTATLTWDVSKTCKQNKNADITEITVSGNGWQNPCGILIFDKDVAANYEITIQMSDNSGICTIMAFGYTA